MNPAYKSNGTLVLLHLAGARAKRRKGGGWKTREGREGKAGEEEKEGKGCRRRMKE